MKLAPRTQHHLRQPPSSKPCAKTGDSASAEHLAERPERGPLRERPPTGIVDHRQLASLRGRRLRRLGPRDDPASCPLGKKGFPFFQGLR